jgi:hypothetical protein
LHDLQLMLARQQHADLPVFPCPPARLPHCAAVPQKHIDFALNSPFGGGRPGRVKRRSQASKKGGDDGGEDEE